MTDLMQVLGTLTESRTGRVRVPGFYDHVRATTAEERDRLKVRMRMGHGVAREGTDTRARGPRRIPSAVLYSLVLAM